MKPISIGKTTALQLRNHFMQKCQVYATFISKQQKEKLDFSYSIHKEFGDVFPEETIGLPPKQDIDFTISLAPGATSISLAPYRMSVLDLVELKMQL